MPTITRALWLALLSCVFLLCGQPTYGGSNDYVVIVLDDSGSMREIMQRDRRSRIDAAKIALAQVISKIPPETNVGLLLLNGSRANNHWYIPLGPVNTREAIDRIGDLRANGGTPLGEALRIAADELLTLRSKKIYGTYRLIVVTDGEASDQVLLDQYLPDILSRGIIIDAIGVDMRGDHSLATKVHSYRRADDQGSLANAIQEIMAERNATDRPGGQDDFSMLDGLGDLDVAEVLKELAKPNNEKVTGISRSQAPASGSNGLSNVPSNVPPAPWVPSPPAGSVTSSPTRTASSFLSQVFGTICTCCVPLLLVMFFVSAFLTSSKKNKRR